VPDGTPPVPWWRQLFTTLREHFTTVLVTTFAGILTIFSGYIVETIKTAVNRADLRVERYQSLSTDVSSHLFSVELLQEFFEHNWTTEPTLKDLLTEYNTSITKLRKNEYVYYQWIARYWDKSALKEFEDIMSLVKKIDHAVHGLNDEFELVNLTKKQPKVNPERAKATAKEMKPLVEDLANKTKAFFTETR
jgi:hypothetical protein